jgi:hypothetical protein
MRNVKIPTTNKDVDILICPKCKETWSAEGHYNYDEGGWSYDNGEEYCPHGCNNFFRFRLKGKLVN